MGLNCTKCDEYQEERFNELNRNSVNCNYGHGGLIVNYQIK